jgi:hypothetical protein
MLTMRFKMTYMIKNVMESKTLLDLDSKMNCNINAKWNKKLLPQNLQK